MTSRLVDAVSNSNFKRSTFEVNKLYGMSVHMAMVRPHAVAMSASPMPELTRRRVEAVLADRVERAHDARHRAEQPEQRGEGDDRVHDHQEAARALDFQARGDLERALHRGVMMVQAVPDRAQARVLRGAGDLGGFLEVAVLDVAEHLFELGAFAQGLLAEPPDGAFQHDGQRDDARRRGSAT